MMKKIIIIMWLLTYVVAIQYIACCSSGNILSKVIGKEWSVSSIDGKILEASEMENGLPNITFDENGDLTGFTGCNTFNGNYKLDGNKIYLDPGSITKMMCFDAPEVEFLNALKEVTGIKLDGNNLELLSGEKPVMTLISEGD